MCVFRSYLRTPRAVEKWRMIRSGHDLHLSAQAAGLGRYGSGADLAKGWIGAGCLYRGLAAPTLHNSLCKYNKFTPHDDFMIRFSLRISISTRCRDARFHARMG